MPLRPIIVDARYVGAIGILLARVDRSLHLLNGLELPQILTSVPIVLGWDPRNDKTLFDPFDGIYPRALS